MKSWQEIYDAIKNEVLAQEPKVNDYSEGSILDIVTGAAATAVHESMVLTVEEFKKTFFDTANGPEVTGGADDLENLAVDHFGTSFARPAAIKATGVVAFSRATTGAGNVTIPAGTVVKTAADANGNSKRFATLIAVLMTGLTINASVEAVDTGTIGNVDSATVTVIESALTDATITVTNALGMTGGVEAESDAIYRETIKRLILSLSGATAQAIEAAALRVSGVVQATVVEQYKTVIEWNEATNTPIGAAFRIPYVTDYIADANGTASSALITAVKAAIAAVRACGVYIAVVAAEAVVVNWTLSITLNPSGPHYSTLSVSSLPIRNSMADYLNNLVTGADFVRSTAEAAIMAIWGPGGSNDLTSVATTIPSGDVSTTAGQKCVPGTMGIA